MNQAVPAGQVYVPPAQPDNTNNKVTLTINNQSVTPSFAGFSEAGVYQINLIVPANLGTGDVPITATVAGFSTPAGVVISLQ